MKSSRLSSVDAYRGVVMLLLLAEVLQLCAVAQAIPQSAIWGFLCYHQSHADWTGCHLHDLIQPSFAFLVGVALPFSVAARTKRGQTFGKMFLHAAVRSLVLIALGIALISIVTGRLLLKFEDTLAQIGLGYWFLFLLAFRSSNFRWAVFGTILVGYWLLFALYPVSPDGIDLARAGVTADWARVNGLSGWEAHWQRNENVAAAFDDWFLRQLPTYSPYVNGLTTLNFVPTLATMILGVRAGEVLGGDSAPQAKIRWLLLAGSVGLAVGGLLDWTGISPLVKSLWTPSWVLFSGGWCFLASAFFYYAVDVRGMRTPAYPLIVIGMNSIVAYMLARLYPHYAFGALRRVVGSDVFRVFGANYEPLMYGLAMLACYWLALYVLYRLRWFVRI